ncbi:unnamed protein product [Spodoptera littoralis]|uniref:Uncharacterized protein n=1 Tax=Spodoptera littoralis TaxID=7109 RepID=A0A9P0N645_SPOLI|nr:unnamed protein product [Spodoptera littoralis]CAH1643818.1 unnamed protein product [Spodoptera littoralis]
MHARRLRVLLIWSFFNISLIWSPYVRLGRPLPMALFICALYTSFVTLLHPSFLHVQTSVTL